MMEIDGRTRVFALLGDPVGHSLSPAMYNAAFKVLGIDAVYVALRCSAGALGSLMESLVRQGGGGNVTVPHKVPAAEALAQLGGPVLSICNTFWANGAGITGAETDSQGILAALGELEVRGGDWLLIGAGGSAKAALCAAKRAGARIAVRSRDPLKGQALLELARELDVKEASAESCTVFINCTPLGLAGTDPMPLDPRVVPEDGVALDLVYARGGTSWVRALRELGRQASDGRTVLVEQGAASFERWFEHQMAPREVMRAAVRSALE
jgi:shikimate dehydrogenase